MKRIKKRYIVICCVALIIVCAAVLMWSQRNNLTALWITLTTDPETLTQRQDESKKRRETILQMEGITGDVLTEDEKTALKEGLFDLEQHLLTRKEQKSSQPTVQPSEGAAQPAVEPAQLAAPSESQTQKEATSSSDPTDNTENCNEAINYYVSLLYAMEDSFEERLGALVEDTKAEYRALPKEERTSENRTALLRGRMNTVIQMEAECDQMVASILDELKTELQDCGGDTSVIGQIQKYYEDCKVEETGRPNREGVRPQDAGVIGQSPHPPSVEMARMLPLS